MPRTLLAALVAVAFLAGCGDEEPTGDPALEDVEVTGDPGEQPTIEFDEPLEMTETATRTIEEGDGEEVATGAVVTFNFVIINGRNGKELSTSFGKEPAELVFEESLMDGIEKGLEGATKGSRVLVGIAPDDGLGADPARGVEEDDTLLLYAEIEDVRTPLTRAEGEPVEPVPGLPTVELAEDGRPTITVPDAEPPTELVAQTLIKGEGPAVEDGQNVTVHYTGVVWDTGKEFGSSWEKGSPTTVGIPDEVIAGWKEGLPGQTVGSQVMLVVPPAKGYPEGTPDGAVPAGATIVFVIDILDAG